MLSHVSIDKHVYDYLYFIDSRINISNENIHL